MPRNNYVAIDKMSAPRLASFADANAFARPFCLVKWCCGMEYYVASMVVADADGPFGSAK